MSKEQLLATIVVLGLLAGAIREFYNLKAEVSELKVHFSYIHGASWHPPSEAQ